MTTTADQCRAMGLKIGSTIDGRETVGDWFVETRLTLLWIGQSIAVWSETSRSNKHPEWSTPKESASWNLGYRKWERVTP